VGRVTLAFPPRETSLVRKARTVSFTPLGADHLAIDSDAGYCWALNAVGARLWKLLDSPATVASICDRLRLEYAVDEETCRRDVLELVGDLVEAGLVTIEDA
jgi:Coenzyme PQQ synthesis protein D (PqqD)